MNMNNNKTFQHGNTITTVVDLTDGIGGRTPEEILALTGAGALKEFTETLPDGRTITYSLEVEEEILEEQQDIEIATSKTITKVTLEGADGNVIESVTNVKDSEEITVLKTNSRAVSKDGACEVEVITSEEKEGGSTETVEYSRNENT